MRYCTGRVFRSRFGGADGDFQRGFVRCYASSGLGLWDKILTDEIRLSIENYWKSKISSQKPARTSKKPENHYVLSMFPYPSGALHMGHVRVYSISDSVSRFHKMRGKNVLHPMGWDAFGLPAENAALERKISPSSWTLSNISRMKSQFTQMGCDFDWDRELKTCDPDYYKWTQMLFLKLYKKSLAYQKESFVNWDPVDRTVLADEQVDQNGLSWRSGAKVEKKLLKQWFIRTTAFASSLYSGLDSPILKEWRDIIKIQKHWIGSPTGTSIDFPLIPPSPSSTSLPQETPKILSLWTEIPEHIHHVEFIAVSKDSFLAKSSTPSASPSPPGEPEPFWRRLEAKVVNPFTSREIPIFLTNMIEFPRSRDNFVGIPGACEVSRNFADVVKLDYGEIQGCQGDEVLRKREEVMAQAREMGIGGFRVSSNLRDWLVSRQRYWGTPIPVVHCPECGVVPVPEEELPVVLPEIENTENFEFQSLKDSLAWLNTPCPTCRAPALRESDTMDTFVDSSWYFLRYIDPHNPQEMFSKEKAEGFLPVDLYIGGKEHAALHLYYARFINHFLHSEGLVPTQEPFRQLLVQGMVMGRSFRIKSSGKYLRPDEVEKKGKTWVEKETKTPVIASWEKMSKSKHNGVDPDDMFRRFGADTTRLIILADVAPISSRNWSEDTFQGVFNWQKRLWLTVGKFLEIRRGVDEGMVGVVKDEERLRKDDEYLFDSRNFYVKGVNFNIVESQQLSVAISKMQGLTNSIRKVHVDCVAHSREYERALAVQIIMLAPMAPQFASELWAGFCSAKYHLAKDDETLNIDKDVLEQHWPEVDMNYELDLSIIVNGNVLDKLKVRREILDTLTGEEAARLASESPQYREFAGDAPINSFRFHSEPGCDRIIYFSVKMEFPKVESTA
ncbi:probable leucine--tRNA ligase, mitochondrial [Diachasma alloeum]|uniref:probable leucine--tRNA ligase, mitochondrial n=1 Tax=Diachasma alloeum TaxID=454923 RepID=UPI000738416E|nr:probable leucine--tRNA ligase, mitochondrial [Diachasma alloeum]